jgi:hypothetical protein
MPSHRRPATLAISLLATMAATLFPVTAAAAGTTEPVPGTIAVVGSAIDGQVFTTARLWDEGVNWCDLAPRADSDVTANLSLLLAPKLDRLVAAGARRVMLPLGHPAPWVFNDQPRARALATRWSGGVRPIWFCGGRASAVSLPSTTSLARNPDGTDSATRRAFTGYVGAVVSFLADRYPQLDVDLQAWNEPNLLNGVDPALRITGAASTTAQIVSSLRVMEGIVATAMASRPGGHFRLVSPSFYQRDNAILRSYLSAENRQPIVSALAFNVYSRRTTPDSMISDWDRRAYNLAKLAGRYWYLRRLPRLITETNHNLNNHKPSDRSNSTATVSAAATQRRLAAATQLNALYRGYSAVYWLMPARNQAAVALSLAAGNPARAALADLGTALGSRRLRSCSLSYATRICYFQDPSGVLPMARALWRMSGARWVSVPPNTMVTDLGTGKTRITAGEAIRVTTIPVVLVATS